MHTVQWTGARMRDPSSHVSKEAEPWGHGRILLSHRIRLQGASHEPWVTSKMCHEVVKMRKCVAVGEKMWEALKSFESENQINIDKLCDIKNHEKSQIRYSIESIDTSSENVKSAACRPAIDIDIGLPGFGRCAWRISSKQMRSSGTAPSSGIPPGFHRGLRENIWWFRT